MFNRIRAQWYYSKLQHAKGDDFVKASEGLSRIVDEEAAKCFLDILVSRRDLSFAEKSAIAEAFASMGAVASKYLLNEIYDENGKLQYSVISALGHIKEIKAVPIFSFLLQATDDPIFARALGDIGSPEAEPVLIEKLVNTESKCRLESFDSLFYISPDSNFDVLYKLLRDKDRFLRKKAAFVLNQNPSRVRNDCDRVLVKTALEEWNALNFDSLEKAETILEIAENCEEKVMKQVVLILINSDFPGKTAFLMRLLAKISDSVKIHLLKNIKFFSKGIEPSEVFELLRSCNTDLRIAAESFLIRFGTSSIPGIFTMLLNDRRQKVLLRTTLLNIAVKIAEKNPESIVEYLKSDDTLTLHLALEIAGETGLDFFNTYLEQILLHIDPETSSKTDCETALLCIWGLGRIAKTDVSTVLPWLNSNEVEIRFAVYEALEGLGDKKAVSAIESIDQNTVSSEERDIITGLLSVLSD